MALLSNKLNKQWNCQVSITLIRSLSFTETFRDSINWFILISNWNKKNENISQYRILYKTYQSKIENKFQSLSNFCIKCYYVKDPVVRAICWKCDIDIYMFLDSWGQVILKKKSKISKIWQGCQFLKFLIFFFFFKSTCPQLSKNI